MSGTRNKGRDGLISLGITVAFHRAQKKSLKPIISHMESAAGRLLTEGNTLLDGRQILQEITSISLVLIKNLILRLLLVIGM